MNMSFQGATALLNFVINMHNTDRQVQGVGSLSHNAVISVGNELMTDQSIRWFTM